MKKLFCIVLTCLFFTIFTGCSDSQKISDSKAQDVLSSQELIDDQEETANEKPLKARDREIDTRKEYVFDDAKLLTDGEYDDLNAYAAWFAKAFKINAVVVLTDDIEDNEPADYAKKFYNDFYNGDGILLLINNDTNEDYFYRKGIPGEFISDSTVLMMFSEISPMLALENYIGAAEYILEASERQLPEYFTDRSKALKKDEISEYNQIIENAAGSNNLNMYYVEGTGEDTIEDFAKKRFKMFYEEDADAAMLVIDGNNGNNYLCTSGNLNYLDNNKSELEKEIKSCYSKSNGVNLKKSSEKFAEYYKENTEE